MYLKYYSTVLKETGGEKMLHWKPTAQPNTRQVTVTPLACKYQSKWLDLDISLV